MPANKPRNKKVTTNRTSSTSGRQLPYFPHKSLLTPGERRFFHQGLLPAVEGRYLVSFKVRLADVIAADNWNSPHARKIAQKHLDFVLVTAKAMRVIAAIELNDASHKHPTRAARDQFVADALYAAGIPLISVPIFRRYDPGRLRSHIERTVRSQRKATIAACPR